VTKTYRKAKRVQYSRAMVISLAVISIFIMLPPAAQNYMVNYLINGGLSLSWS
jgi:hypothetical protein